jgi:hypothetical protein
MVALPWTFEAAAHQAMSNIDLALDLARQGVAVFPCCPDGAEAKRPYPGVFWRNQSTTNDLRIRQWWDRWPDALPAIDLAKTDLMVIDLDGTGGIEDWAEVSRGRACRPPSVSTPGGGRHLWFSREGRQYGNGRGALPPKRDHQGIDVRGHGGYVIAPSAVMLDGRRYEPDGHDFLSAEPLPEWLAEILAGRPSGPAASIDGVSLARQPVPAPDDGASPFFRNVNTAALASLAAWVPLIFGRDASYQSSTGAYRIPSRRLGRDLQEDLSIAPTGIVDWGIHDMGDARVGKRTPIDIVMEYGEAREVLPAANWLCDKLGRSPASLGWADDGRGAEIAAALLGARQVIQAADGTLADAETGEIIEQGDPDGDELPAHLARPPGLVGALADWICDTARRPQRALAIGAALTIVGTAAGRHIMGPTRSGTHLYVVGLAPTGAGKDHAMQQILSALTAVDAQHLIGPSQFISMPAVINFLQRKPLSVCAMDEFGAFLKRIGSRKASGFEGAISGMLRTAWSSPFKPMPTPEWAGRQSETIMAPAMSIYGVSTAEEFYGALEGGDMSNGLLNRILVVETRSRPKDGRPAAKDHALPASLATRLREVLGADTTTFAQLQRTDVIPPYVEAVWGPGAEDAYADLIESVHERCDNDVMAQAFYARVAETAIRLATILAVGMDPRRPVVTEGLFAWAREFSLWCAKTLARGGMEHISDSENQSAANQVRRAIREAGGRMKHRDLLRRLNHKIKDRDLRDIVKALAEAEHIVIEKVTPSGGGTPSVWYASA